MSGKQLISNMYLYWFNCPASDDPSFAAYANVRGFALLTYCHGKHGVGFS